MKLLLTGASGFIGGHLRTALEAAGHELVHCSRSSGHDFTQMLSADDWVPLLEGVDAVINAVGIIVETGQQSFDVLHRQAPSALFEACQQQNIQRVIQISALGADEHAFTPYQISKKAADDRLRKTDLDWFVLRPSLVYGEGGASMAMFRQLSSLPIIPLVGDGQYKVQPIHVSDVVATVMQCLSPEAESQQTLDVVGAFPLSFAGWLQAIRGVSGRKPAMLFKTPFSMMLAVAGIGKYVMPMMSPDNLRMLQAGNTSDVAPITRFLGRAPLPVEEGLRL
uniref:Epimerase n=1 Tax=uncultured Thiotrichaceae bacterium TaxID=298394 RepID=A0A6S6T5G5_9GAMM|nr:MAG: Epimerase [uncultured Thiotrichaceae bacterium]